MRLILAPLVLCLSACSGPDQYERGVRPPAPRAPTYHPSLDAPHTQGQPGYVDSTGRVVPRSKDKRYLPPEGRPGIWASDSQGNTKVVVARLQAPPPVLEGITHKAWEQCWSDVQTCLLADPRMVRAGLSDYACLRERLVNACGMIRSDRGWMRHQYTLRKYGNGPYDVGDFSAASSARLWAACAVIDSDKEQIEMLYRSLYPKCNRAWVEEGQK